MSSAYKSFTTKETPQRERIPGRADQVENSEGAFVFEVDKWTLLNRFLVLGSEDGSFYATERELTADNAANVIACVKEDGLRAVQVITDISVEGRAPKNSPALFALAIACAQGDVPTRQAAFASIVKVARTGTHLFEFCSYVQNFRGWGYGLRHGVQAWYTDKDLDALAYQLVKYRQRDGWTHRDVLAKSHPKLGSDDGPEALRNLTLRWAVEQPKLTPEDKEHTTPNPLLPGIIHGYEKAQASPSAKHTAELVKQYNLPREVLNTDHLNDPAVWSALLYAGGKYGMPVGAMVRNLATMTRVGLLEPFNANAVKFVTDKLRDPEAIKGARIHPLGILSAMKTYASGKSIRGNATWAPVPAIVDALDDAFYLAFDNVEATGLRYMLALDVSGSMDGSDQGGFYRGFPNVSGMPELSPREAASAMAMVTMKVGDPYEVVAFTSAGDSYYQRQGWKNLPQAIPGISVLPFSPRQRLDDIVEATNRLFPGGTDASLPMLYAIEQEREVDVFICYTDSESWAGEIHPIQALDKYRNASGINAKLICVNLVANPYSIADPNDVNTLDVVGFDTSAPTIMEAFAKGEI